MADKGNSRQHENEESSSALPPAAPEPCRQVVVTHLDSPPPLGKHTIHPRRPAPTVPTRQQRVREESANRGKSDRSAGE